MSKPLPKIEYTKEELVEVERFRLFLHVTGVLARVADQAAPPDPTLLELLLAADSETNWRVWLGLAPPTQHVTDDHPHP